MTEFYVDDNNNPKHNTIYRKTSTGKITRKDPTKYLIDYLDAQGIVLSKSGLEDGIAQENNIQEKIQHIEIPDEEIEEIII